MSECSYFRQIKKNEQTAADAASFELATAESIDGMDLEKAFALIKFYEAQAGTVKTRVWTISTWILTLNTGLIAFGFNLYTETLDTSVLLILEFVVCIVGVALCVFLTEVIEDHGGHLQRYFTNANRVGKWNEQIRALVLTPEEFSKTLKPDYKAGFPGFCKKLCFLTKMFLVGFVGLFLLVAFLKLLL